MRKSSLGALLAAVVVALLLSQACGARRMTPLPTAALLATPILAPTTAATPSDVTTTSQALRYEDLLYLFDYDQKAPLSIQEVSVGERTGVKVHDISYVSPKGGRVPAYLVIPDGPGTFAGVILQHGLPGTRSYHLDYAIRLAKTGAVALLIDAPFARPANANRVAGEVMFTEQDREEQIQLIVDLRRGIDLLSSRGDVDAERMAYIGFGYGADIGGQLAGVEKRIKAYILAVGSGGLVEQQTRGGDWTTPFQRLSKEQRDEWLTAMEPIKPIYYVGHAAPAALFFQAASIDRVIREAAAIQFQQAGSEPKRVNWYVAGHSWNAEAIRDQVLWLQTQIDIDEEKFEAPTFVSPPVDSASDTRPTWSPDSRYIAFVSYRDGNSEVYVMDADGSIQTRLTNTPGTGTTYAPEWSPDGSKIAFDSDRDGNREIYLMNADGTNQTRLTNNFTSDAYPEWSPDGARIAFQSERDGNLEIYVMNADGSNQTRLTNNPARDYLSGWFTYGFSAWSPDSRHIAFMSLRDGNYEIYVMNADGSNQINLSNNVAGDNLPTWSPDGRYIAFISERDGNEEIYLMQADGAEQTNLTNNPAPDCCPSWRPDGLSITFMSLRDKLVDGESLDEIYVIRTDGSEQSNLTNNQARDGRPLWSPDGRHIAFVSQRDGRNEIYVMNADGSSQTGLTNNPADDSP